MTNEQLVEQIARTLAIHNNWEPDEPERLSWPSRPKWQSYAPTARAILPIILAALAERDATIAEQAKQIEALREDKKRLEYAVIKAAAPDFMTEAERAALHDFVQFLRSTEGGEVHKALDAEPVMKSPKERCR